MHCNCNALLCLPGQCLDFAVLNGVTLLILHAAVIQTLQERFVVLAAAAVNQELDCHVSSIDIPAALSNSLSAHRSKTAMSSASRRER